MTTTLDLAPLVGWPREQPIGVLALTDAEALGWRARVADAPEVGDWVDLAAQNMFSGPSVEPPFRRALLFEPSDAAAAGVIAADLVKEVGEGHATVYVGSPLARRARTAMRLLSSLLRLLPAPQPPAGPASAPARPPSEVNPRAEQLERFLSLPPEPSVVALNLNLHLEQGTNPDTGAKESGRTIADHYFRRGIRTFTRLGARPTWAGSCRAALVDGLGFGAFDQIGLIDYPSRRSFATLMQIAQAEDWGRYREAGLARSWVVHCGVEASR